MGGQLWWAFAFLAARHCAFHCYNNHLSCLCLQLTNKLIGLIGLDWLRIAAFCVTPTLPQAAAGQKWWCWLLITRYIHANSYYTLIVAKHGIYFMLWQCPSGNSIPFERSPLAITNDPGLIKELMKIKTAVTLQVETKTGHWQLTCIIPNSSVVPYLSSLNHGRRCHLSIWPRIGLSRQCTLGGFST